MRQDSQQIESCSSREGGSRSPEEPLPVCCGTGCVVCVLDYPELYQDPQTQGPDPLALLEAFEKAEQTIAQQQNES